MATEHDRQPRVPLSPEADAAAEDETQVSSAAGPASELPPEEALSEDAAPAHLPEEEQDAKAAGEASDHEAQLEHDLEELAARAGKADEYLELAKRTKADFENYRKRAAREAAAAQQRGVVKPAHELRPAVDDLDRAVGALQGAPGAQHGEDGVGTLVSGIKLVHAGVFAALA